MIDLHLVTRKTYDQLVSEIAELATEYEEARSKEHLRAVNSGAKGAFIAGFPVAIAASSFFEGLLAGVISCIVISTAFAGCYFPTRGVAAQEYMIGSNWSRHRMHQLMDAKDEMDRERRND